MSPKVTKSMEKHLTFGLLVSFWFIMTHDRYANANTTAGYAQDTAAATLTPTHTQTNPSYEHDSGELDGDAPPDRQNTDWDAGTYGCDALNLPRLACVNC